MIDKIKNEGHPFPRMTIGVMGSSGGRIATEVLSTARHLGSAIGRRGHILITGACPGIPHKAVEGAKAEGGFVVGISPAINLKEHVRKYHSPTLGYDAIIYTGSGLMGREIENIRSCDVVIFAAGRTGTLGEFAIAYQEGKVIGVLEGTGGITQHLHKIIKMMDKETEAIVCYDTDVERLLDKLEHVYKEHILPDQLRISKSRDPDEDLKPNRGQTL